jgi:hypothetical protein
MTSNEWLLLFMLTLSCYTLYALFKENRAPPQAYGTVLQIRNCPGCGEKIFDLARPNGYREWVNHDATPHACRG